MQHKLHGETTAIRLDDARLHKGNKSDTVYYCVDIAGSLGDCAISNDITNNSSDSATLDAVTATRY